MQDLVAYGGEDQETKTPCLRFGVQSCQRPLIFQVGSALLPFFGGRGVPPVLCMLFGEIGGVPPAKIDYRKKGTPFPTSLLEDLILLAGAI